MYLLDTDVISEVRKPKPHGGVIAWLQGIPDQEIRLSAATLGELQNGVEITRRQNREKAIQIEKWIDQVAATHQVLPIDGNVFREWGRLIEQPDQLIDSLLPPPHASTVSCSLPGTRGIFSPSMCLESVHRKTTTNDGSQAAAKVGNTM